MEKKVILIAGILTVAAALLLPGYLGRRAQLEKVFAAFDALEAAPDMPAERILREHMILAAKSEMDVMETREPGFAQSEIGRNLQEALEMFQPKLSEKAIVSDKEHYLRFSEVEFEAITEKDWEEFQRRRASKTEKEGDYIHLLQPRAPVELIREGYRARAKGHLQNARILAGRARGELYVPPEPRKEHMWMDSLPVVHPHRKP